MLAALSTYNHSGTNALDSGKGSDYRKRFPFGSVEASPIVGTERMLSRASAFDRICMKNIT